MATTMMALKASGPRDYALTTDAPRPEAGPLELVLQTIAVGICASDSKMFAGGDLFWKQPGGRVSASLPVVPGHEFVGRVALIGEPRRPEHAALAVGDVVVVEQLVACGNCWFCKHGGPHKCDLLKVFGQGLDGPLAELVRIPATAFVHPVPQALAMPDAAWQAFFAEPLSIAMRAVDRAELPLDASDATVVVIGCGTVGLCVIAAVRAMRPGVRIVAVDLHEYKLRVASACGADVSVTVGDQLELAAHSFNEGRGADVVFEAAGSAQSIVSATRLVRKMGRVVNLSITNKSMQPFDWNALSAGKELSVVGSSLGHGYWPAALDLIARGALPCELMASHRLPLRLWAEGLQLAGAALQVTTI